jgi:acetoin utilization deacetylase AcuC-like enzyme
MLKTGYVIDPRYTNHRSPMGHPERPERIGVLLEWMRGYARDALHSIEPRMATRAEILLNHDESYIDDVVATAARASSFFDADTYASKDSFDTALLAVGGVASVLDRIMDGTVDNGIALVRPPGHHAEADRAMGFCLFNNVAVGARYLQHSYGLERILIMDWDVHHGNGTQRSFFADKSVLYMSTHQYPFYPGTGALEDVGIGGGIGHTVNLPFPAGYGDDEYIDAFRRVIEPIAHQFDPQFVLVSAGFDAHHLDPLGGMRVTADGFASMARSLLRVARDRSQGRCAAVLEGGYNLDALVESVACLADEFRGEHLSEEADADGVADGGGVMNAIIRVQSEFWDL